MSDAASERIEAAVGQQQQRGLPSWGAAESVINSDSGFGRVPDFGFGQNRMNNPDQHVTVLLGRIRDGDAVAKSELLNLTYSELRGLAAHVFRGQSGDHTLQPTALVNELCIKLLRSEGQEWADRKHFFRAAARAMRNLLTDHARAKNAERRSGGMMTVCLDGSEAARPSDGVDLIELDETLTRLAATDERLGEVFELRFLAGLSVEKTGDILGVSPRTIEADTRFIRAWLQKELFS